MVGFLYRQQVKNTAYLNDIEITIVCKNQGLLWIHSNSPVFYAARIASVIRTLLYKFTVKMNSEWKTPETLGR